MVQQSTQAEQIERDGWVKWFSLPTVIHSTRLSLRLTCPRNSDKKCLICSLRAWSWQVVFRGGEDWTSSHRFSRIVRLLKLFKTGRKRHQWEMPCKWKLNPLFWVNLMSNHFKRRSQLDAKSYGDRVESWLQASWFIGAHAAWGGQYGELFQNIPLCIATLGPKSEINIFITNFNSPLGFNVSPPKEMSHNGCVSIARRCQTLHIKTSTVYSCQTDSWWLTEIWNLDV